MPKFQLQVAKIVGKPTETGWSQIHYFSPENSQKMARRGQLVAVICLSGLEPGIEAVAAGREVLARLHEEYYGFLEAPAFEQLTQAVKKVQAEPAEEAKVEICAGALIKNVFYLAVSGKGRVLLRRGDQIVFLVGGSQEPVSASGYVQAGDLFVLGSADFFEIVAEGVLNAALASDALDQVAEVLAPAVQSQESSGLAAAALAMVEAEVETILPRLKETPAVAEEIKSEVGLPLASAFPQKMVRRLQSRGVVFGQALAQYFSRFIFALQKKLGKRTIYLRQKAAQTTGQEKRSQKTLSTVALVLLFLLVVSVVLGSRQRQRAGLLQKTQILFKQAQTKKEEGEALLSLNPLRAKELLLEAQSLFNQIESQGPLTTENQDFKNSLEAALAQVLHEHKVEVNFFYDLGLIKEGALATDFAYSAGQLIILDQTQNGLYQVGLIDRRQTILASGQEFHSGIQVTAFLPKVFVLTESGLIQIDKESKKQTLVIETDSAWEKIVDLHTFGGNLYLLDTNGEIWQYLAIETGFGTRRRWLKEGRSDFGEAVSMAIDGAVWVLKKDGTILKFVRGVKDAFGISGLDKPLSNPTTIFANADQKYLYIFDKGNSRVVVLDKSGEYHSQYLWEGVKDASSLVALEKEDKIFLLSGSKIHEIKLKN